MTFVKRLSSIRLPITDAEYEAGARYYSEDDIAYILKWLPDHESIDRDTFRSEIENSAFWYVNRACGENVFSSPPSIEFRTLEALHNLSRRLLEDIREIPPRLRANLESAADDLARKSGKLPDFEPQRVDLPPLPDGGNDDASFITVWPVDRQISKSLDELAWLRS
jgi:hypothetical protein